METPVESIVYLIFIFKISVACKVSQVCVSQGDLNLSFIWLSSLNVSRAHVIFYLLIVSCKCKQLLRKQWIMRINMDISNSAHTIRYVITWWALKHVAAQHWSCKILFEGNDINDECCFCWNKVLISKCDLMLILWDFYLLDFTTT